MRCCDLGVSDRCWLIRHVCMSALWARLLRCTSVLLVRARAAPGGAAGWLSALGRGCPRSTLARSPAAPAGSARGLSYLGPGCPCSTLPVSRPAPPSEVGKALPLPRPCRSLGPPSGVAPSPPLRRRRTPRAAPAPPTPVTACHPRTGPRQQRRITRPGRPRGGRAQARATRWPTHTASWVPGVRAWALVVAQTRAAKPG